MLVGAFEIHHGVGPAVDLAGDAGEPGKVRGVFQHESVRGAGIEPDVENVVDLLPAFVGEFLQKTLARARLVPGVRTLLLERLDDADIDIGIAEHLDRSVRLLLDE